MLGNIIIKPFNISIIGLVWEITRKVPKTTISFAIIIRRIGTNYKEINPSKYGKIERPINWLKPIAFTLFLRLTT